MGKVQLTEKEEKILQYQVKILGQLQGLINDESCENYIGIEELSEGENMTLFIHALANCAPNHVYQTLTGDYPDNLGFNHLANRLCVQYGSK